MNTLYIDLETYSPTSIKAGVYKYAEGVEILLLAYAFNDAPVQVVDLTASKKMAVDFWNALKNADTICAHNSQFDRVVLNKVFPHIFTKPWRDTMIRAYAHGLPGSLDMLSTICKLPVDKAKDKEGKKLVHLFCKPHPDTKYIRATSETHPKEWAQFIEYARLDIEAMREIDKKLPVWNDTAEERALWYLDQKINDRGIAVDTVLAKAALEAVAKEKEERDTLTKEKTNGEVNSATQRDALLKHLLDIHGVYLPDLQIATLTRRLEDPDLPEPVKELITIRLQASGTSTKKYETLLNAVSSDGRLRGTLQFCGASRTGRWSGRIFQPQNLPRPTYKANEIEVGIESIKTGHACLLWDNVKDLAASALRGVIIAPPGKKLVVADLSSIEGRMLAWLAGERWKINAYKDYDNGTGYDMYVLTYARTFGVKPETVTKSQRQLGKVLELALGYGGGAGAFVTFARGYNINLDELIRVEIPEVTFCEAEKFYNYLADNGKSTLELSKEVFIACDSIKRLWREANPNIVRYWSNLEDAVYRALDGGTTTQGITYAVDKKGTWLRIKLPSGRYLCYAGARIEDSKIKYLGINQYSRKWEPLATYGGKIAENVTQAASRDILAYGMNYAERAGYEVVLSVHDELLTETPDKPAFNVKTLSSLMSTAPTWAAGLPLAAAGFEAYRYRKD